MKLSKVGVWGVLSGLLLAVGAGAIPASFEVKNPRLCEPVNTNLEWVRNKSCDNLPANLEGQVCACTDVQRGSRHYAKVTRGMSFFDRQREEAEERALTNGN